MTSDLKPAARKPVPKARTRRGFTLIEMLVAIGLLLVIGVMIIGFNAAQLDFMTGRSQGLTGGQMLLTGVLYLVAFTCFAGAGYVFWLAIRHLLRSGSH